MTAHLVDLVDALSAAGAASGHPVASPLDLIDPNNLIDRFGSLALVGILVIVFVETGLVFPFLPGDSLLFTAGLLVAAAKPGSHLDIPLPLLIGMLFCAAFAGNQCGYLVGKLAGPKLFSRPDSRILRPEFIEKTNEYFDRYGGRTILLAQFVPVVRTFAPIAAGIGRMRYRTFAPYSLVGTFVWTALVTTLGYFLGNVPFIRDNIEPIFIAIVLLSVVPIALEARKQSRASRAAAGEQVAPGPRHGRAAGVPPRPVEDTVHPQREDA
ncbi:VTT domain-containing protein [Luteimicrobium subarcticum]|uniref:Membrane-associated protein n=1 Tax=Luteimicrobium subarcticum TaxID=620910 RepID=A0A2M8WS68_9MICO|nr:VTT domain-containing protein [Luteimicrobium subarcticum]PJI93763.1 membrane-associated protein [Luteimicrobium subarcticum]